MCIGMPLLFKDEYYSIVWIDILFIQSSVDGHLGSSHLLAVMSSVAMHVGAQIAV